MSIALDTKVNSLADRIAKLEETLLETRNALIDTNERLLAARERISVLDQTSVRRPGPKPKDAANG